MMFPGLRLQRKDTLGKPIEFFTPCACAAGAVNRPHDEFAESGRLVRLDPFHEPARSDREHLAHVAIFPALGKSGNYGWGWLSDAIRQAHTKMLGIDPMPIARRQRLNGLTSAACLAGRHRSREPAIGASGNPIDSGIALTTEPDLEWLLSRRGYDANILEAKRPKRRSHRLPAPPLAHQPHHRLNRLPAVALLVTKGRPLSRLSEAGHERNEQSAMRQAIDLCELLGHPEWISAERHDIRPELEALGDPSGKCKGDERIAELPQGNIGQPQGVETKHLGPSKVVRPNGLIERARGRCDGKTGFHPPIIAVQDRTARPVLAQRTLGGIAGDNPTVILVR